MSKKIKIAIAGVGNCASSLIMGIDYYTNHNVNGAGLIHKNIGAYQVGDIEIVAAFDVNLMKVDKPLSEAIKAFPNNSYEVKNSEVYQIPDITVLPGIKADGIEGLHGTKTYSHYVFPVIEDKSGGYDRVADALKESGAEVLINLIPVGSCKASRIYAKLALETGIDFINCIPEEICRDPEWQEKFKSSGLRCIGDDIKSQVGATILHRSICELIEKRGHKISNSYQLNIGGNTDFENMLNPSRIVTKKKSKTDAVEGVTKIKSRDLSIGPSDFVPHLGDAKHAIIQINGYQFMGAPFSMDIKLQVQDSPNSAGVLVDLIRLNRLAKDHGITGYLDVVSQAYCKFPTNQVVDSIALENIELFIKDPLTMSS